MFRKRTYAGFKRKRGGNAIRTFKKRKYNPKRRFTGRSSGFGNRSDTFVSVGFRGKKWSRSRWNRALWNSTQQKAHYRVASTWLDTIATPTDASLCQCTIYQATSNGSSFWTVGGGLIDVDGGTAPLFTDDMVIRGGTLSITCTYVDTTVSLGDHMKIRLYLVRGAKNINLSGFNSATRAASWDLTMFPEFRDCIGKVIMSKEFDLGISNGQSMTFRRRIGIQKVDQNAWTSLSTGRYYWVVIATNPGNNSSVTANLAMSMNMSVSGDAIGTT